MYPPITPQDLSDFHDARGVLGVPCWVCGAAEWLLQSTETEPFRLLPAGDMTQGAQPLAVVPLICKKCGTIWPVAYGTVRTWLKNRAESEHGNEP